MIPLGPFVLDHPFARGGMGEVWRGVHRASGEAVAVKVMGVEGARRPEIRQALQDEVRAVASLDHPNVVWVHDTGEIPQATAVASDGQLVAGSPYLVLELADGGTVREQLRTLTWPRLRRITSQVLDGLAHAHARGVVHRDLKPANLLLHGPTQQLLLTDFGIAHVIDRTRVGDAGGGVAWGVGRLEDDTALTGTNPDSPVGTPGYMAPEQFAGLWRDQGPWTDLYAVGCLVWLVASGTRPFAGRGWLAQARARQQGQLVAWAPRWDVPRGLEAWLRRTLAVDPADRFQFAAEARAALDALDGPAAEPSPPRRRDLRLHGAGLGLYGLRAIPLVGREAERRQLWGALEDARAMGRPRAVVVRGPAGSGKSRLAEWLCTRARREGRAVSFRAVHGDMPGPADGLVGMVARALRCLGETRDQIETRAHEVVSEPDEALAVAELLAPSPAEAPGRVALASPQERYALVLGTLRRIGRGAPAVLWLDDAVLGPDTVAFVAWVLEHGEGSLVLVLTVPDEALAKWPEAAAMIEELQARPDVEELPLGPLGAEGRQAMVEELLSLEPGLAREVAERTAGNPLFAVQLVGDWVERGLLQVGPHGFRRTGSAQLPVSLQQVWASRIEHVVDAAPPAARVGLQVAAVLGAQVDEVEWVDVCGRVGASASTELVAELVGLRLARREPGGWSFVHGMLREAIAAGADVVLHEACASMLEARTAPVDRWRRGRHLLQAGRWESGVAELQAASGMLIRLDSLAAEQAERAARQSLLQHGVGASEERLQRSAWRLLLCAHLLGRYAQAEQDAQALRTSPLPEARHVALRVLGEQARMSGRFDEARRHWEAGLNDAERVGDGKMVGLFCRGLGVLAAHHGDLDVARDWLERALRAYDAVGTSDRFDALLALAYVEHLAGDRDVLADRLQEARDNAVRIGARSGVGLVLNLQAESAREAGLLDEAEQAYREALRVLEATGSVERHVARINLGLLLLERGEITTARTELAATLDGAERLARTLWQLTIRMGLLVCAADDDDWDEHLSAYRDLDAGGRYLDPDLARLATMAAVRARAGRRADRAAAAWRLAEHQWRGLGRADAADRARAEADQS